MAMSRLGAVYDKVLKLKSRAKDYFNLCMQLVVSMHPRTFNRESTQTFIHKLKYELRSMTDQRHIMCGVLPGPELSFTSHSTLNGSFRRCSSQPVSWLVGLLKPEPE